MSQGVIPDNHLTASRIGTFNRCPMQYYFRYCEGKTAPPSAPMSLGSAVHVAIGYNYEQKRGSREDLPLDDVLDVFSTDFDERRHETAWWENEKPGAFKDQGAAMLGVYQGEVSVTVQPASVERSFEIPFENYDWTFTGRIDVIDDSDVVMEMKTIGRTPSKPDEGHKLQTVGYTTGFRAEGNTESGARLVYLVKNKTPKIVSYSFKVKAVEIEFFLAKVARVALMIENEMFTDSRHLSPFPCSRKFCGYAADCERKIGGIVPER